MQKKKFQVIKNTTNSEFTGLDVDGRKMKFGRNGTFVVDAPGLASDIDKTFGRKGNQSVAVVPYNDHETRELGHKYKFGPSESYAKAWEDFERRRKAKQRKAGSHAVEKRKKQKGDQTEH
jgi:hypothetical protein